jgi:hypothetical protein
MNKIDLEEIRWESVDWIRLSREMSVADICEHSIEALGSVKGVTSQQLERLLGCEGPYPTAIRIIS